MNADQFAPSSLWIGSILRRVFAFILHEKGIIMAKKRVLVEFGMGTSLRRMDYTEAAARAVRDALWHNSVNMAELFGFEKDAMLVDVEIAVQNPDAVDVAELAAIFPYGQVEIRVTHGGLDVPKPGLEAGGGHTVIANAAIAVSFDLEEVA